ncbi:PD-(D/E)XK motif protein [Hyphobacterium sp. SN044]|uniref:PD-(D/E)XK motif protein n=1 Tax=Hyphobacterium sp. SN044 TaxID=2912575 RepID=UPI001F32575E|nr:PD-(D/E)XK motif protein [Hyphobacterium sp. SN044]MCF8880516.1 PD-(D/E)XK motif protein [Hyphobacterium sp. SN044]
MLTDLYPKLCQTIPQDGAALFGLPVGRDYPYWLAVDAQAFPALLLPARANDFRPDITLRAVDALFSRICVIDTDSSEPHEGCYSLVRLKESDPAIVRLFLRILEESFCAKRPPTTNAEIAARVQQVATLFSRVEDNTRDLVGLWGELTLISHAQNTDAAVRCWSSRKTAKYDFVAEHFVLDVKTTTKPVPQHRFSLDQLRPSGAFDAYIASLCVIEVPSGQTVADLLETVSARISDRDLRSAFLTQCLTKGGRDLYRSNLVLQAYPDNASLNLFRAAEIPVPHVHASDPIENIRFDVDLSEIVPLPDQYRTSILTFEIAK